eukprot:2119145-Karenia_brevis.AAC.1
MTPAAVVRSKLPCGAVMGRIGICNIFPVPTVDCTACVDLATNMESRHFPREALHSAHQKIVDTR